MVVKFLILGDLHGVKPKILTDDYDAIISVGDICGDDIKKYIKKWIKIRTETKEYDLDFYKVCPRWKERIYSKISILKGKRIFRFLNKLEKPVFIVSGNWDPTPNDGLPKKKVGEYTNYKFWNSLFTDKKNIYNVEHKKRNFKGITIVGHGSTSAPEVLKKVPKSNMDKIRKKDLKEYEYRLKYFTKVYDKLSKWIKQSKNPVIIISHNSVYNTKLDEVHMKGSYADGEHYGSILVRKLVDKYKPMFAVGGHIHEGYGREDIDKTICINAGYGGNVNTLVIIDEKKGEVVDVEFLGESRDND